MVIGEGLIGKKIGLSPNPLINKGKIVLSPNLL